MEHLKKIPWEVWVGLGLTVVVAWWTTRQSVQAGQATAQGVIASQAGTGPGTTSGLGQELGTYQSQTLQAIGDMQRQNTALAETIGSPQDVTSGNQQSLFGVIGAGNSANAQGLTNINGALTGISSSLSDMGGTLVTLQQGNAQTLANTQTIINGQAAAAAQMGEVQRVAQSANQQGIATNQFLGWLFYQLPNRYSAYIPGQNASNAGQSVGPSGNGPTG